MTVWPALAAALVWAIATPAVSRGVAALPDLQRREALIQALFVAVLSGCVVLAPVALASDPLPAWNGYVVLAGVLTFAVGTLLYYLTAYAFGAQAEMASQFARVKPLFSVILAAVLLHEVVGRSTAIATGLVCLGLALFAWGAAKGQMTWASVGFGVVLAAVWALGELFVGLGFPGGGGVAQTWIGLLASAVALLPLAVWATVRRPLSRADAGWLPWFAAHGVFSFALAYTLFFYSIVRAGLISTALVTAFWPVVAMTLGYIVARFRKRAFRVPASAWAAALLLLAGSVVQALVGA